MNKKLTIKIMAFAILIFLCAGTASFANVQSRPGVTTLKNKTASDFFSLIRGMQSSGQAMGLDATATNIDVHMAKNTEWGTAAMLSASSYGKTGTVGANDSTTGNNYGIYQMGDGSYEYVAGIYSSVNSAVAANVANVRNAAARYKNVYSSAAYKPRRCNTRNCWLERSNSLEFYLYGKSNLPSWRSCGVWLRLHDWHWKCDTFVSCCCSVW